MESIIKEKISLKDLEKMYGVSRRTLYNWIRYRQLPVVEITPQQKWVYTEDLIEWERSFIKNDTDKPK